MIARDAPARLKVGFFAAVAGFAAGGCLTAWMALSDLLPVLNRSAAGAPVVEFSPSSLFGLPLALAFFCFAAMALLPAGRLGPGRHRGKAAAPAPPRAAGVLLAIAIGCIPVAFLAAPIGRGIVAGVVEGRGYRACPPATDQRRAPLRWARTGLSCP